MRRTLRSALALMAAAATLLVTARPSPAQDEPVGLAMERHTDVKYDPTWIRFRPNPYNGEHLNTYPGNGHRTYCYAGGTDDERWELVYDGWQKFAGWTHAYNLTYTAFDHCDQVGTETDLTLDVAWVHLAPHEDWAYEPVYRSSNLYALCYYRVSESSTRWELVVDRSNGYRAGFTYASYLNRDKLSWIPC
ncbi:hypothetical protein [Lentzea sp. NPDC059081]|uniref:hypothetical protein n=1 Tax=Lentzea sp. NPDC059081 TaxID=3346719 RepID=UPI003697C399